MSKPYKKRIIQEDSDESASEEPQVSPARVHRRLSSFASCSASPAASCALYPVGNHS